MKKITQISVFILLVLIGFSCSKTSDVSPQNNVSAIARTWIVQETSVTGGGKSATIYTKGGLVNLYDFSKYKVVLTADGNGSVTDQSGVTSTGTWVLLNTDKQIQFTFSDKTQQTFDISSVSATNLNVSQNLTKNTLSNWNTVLQALSLLAGFDTSITSLTMSFKMIPQ